jgi:hypothetical protein
MAPVVSANSLYTYEEEANELNQLALYLGTNTEGKFEADLGSKLNRQTATVMLLRMFGEEKDALAMNLEDAKMILVKEIRDASEVSDWAAKQVAYGIQKGYIKGYEDKTFRPERNVTGREYTTLNLKMLGYTFKFEEAGDFFGDVAELDLDETDDFGVNAEIKKDIFVGISHRALLAKFEGKETRLVEKLIEMGIVTFEKVEEAAPSVALVIKDMFVTPAPTASPTPEVTLAPLEVNAVTGVTATNGNVVVMFEKEFVTAPVASDFKVTQSVAVDAATPVVTDVTGTLVMDAKTATLTLTPVAVQPQNQTVSYSVVVRGNDAVESNKVTVVGTAQVTSIVAINKTNDKDKVTLVGGALVPANAEFEITFDEAVDVATLNSSTVKLLKAGALVAKTMEESADKKVVTITTSSSMEDGKSYKMIVEGVKLASGKEVKKIEIDFEVSPNVVITAMKYKDGGVESDFTTTNVIDANTVTFAAADELRFYVNKSLDTSTVNTGTVKLKNITDAEYVAADAVSYTVADKVIVFKLAGALSQDKYEVQFNNVRALDGSDLTAFNRYFHYSKANITYTKQGVLGTSTVDVFNRLKGELLEDTYYSGFKAQFTSNKELDSKTINGDNVILYEVDGSDDKMVDSVVEFNGGMITITPTLDLKEDTDYKVELNGIEDTDGIEYPDSTVLFNTGDYSPVEIKTVTPIQGTTVDVDDAKLVFTFSEKVEDDNGEVALKNAANFDTNATIIVYDASNDVAVDIAAVTKTWNSDRTVLELDLSDVLEVGKTYTVEVAGEDSGTGYLRADSGEVKKLVSDYELTFQTADDSTAPVVESIESSDDETDLTSKATGVGVAEDIVITFDEAVKFTNRTGTTGTDTATALQALGNDSDVRIFNITDDVYIDVDTATNKVSLDSTNKIMTIDVSTIAAYVNEKKYRIELTKEIEDMKENGLKAMEYIYSVGTKPEINFANSYPARFGTIRAASDDVYVVFTEAGELSVDLLNGNNIKLKDSTGTEIKSTVTRGTTNKSVTLVGAAVQLTSVDTNNIVKVALTTADLAKVSVGDFVTVTTDSPATYSGVITVKGTDSTADTQIAVKNVDVSTSADVGDQTSVKLYPYAKINPEKDDLATGTYTVEVTNMLDVAGNQLNTPTLYTFDVEDDVAPAVSSITPADGLGNIAVNSEIKLVFDEAIKSSTITTANLFVETSTGTLVPSDVKYDILTKTATITTKSYLKASTQYNVYMNESAIKDVTDNAVSGSVKELQGTFATNNVSMAPKLTKAVYKDNTTVDKDTLTLFFDRPVKTDAVINDNTKLNASFLVEGGTVVYSTISPADTSALQNTIIVTLTDASTIVPGTTTVKAISEKVVDTYSESIDLSSVVITE